MTDQNTESLRQEREHLRQVAPDLLAALEPLITKYNLNDKDAFDMLFDATCAHDSGVKTASIVNGMAYDLEHGLRPEAP